MLGPVGYPFWSASVTEQKTTLQTWYNMGTPTLRPGDHWHLTYPARYQAEERYLFIYLFINPTFYLVRFDTRSF